MRPSSTPCNRHTMMCVHCGKRSTDPGPAIGRGCAWVFVMLAGVVFLAPLVWLAREAMEWALGV